MVMGFVLFWGFAHQKNSKLLIPIKKVKQRVILENVSPVLLATEKPIKFSPVPIFLLWKILDLMISGNCS